MPSTGLEPATPATKRPQTYALDRYQGRLSVSYRPDIMHWTDATGSGSTTDRTSAVYKLQGNFDSLTRNACFILASCRGKWNWTPNSYTSVPSYTYSFYKPAMFHFINISATCFGCLHKPSSGTMRTLFMRNWNTTVFAISLQFIF
jgi:hypothetical protein